MNKHIVIIIYSLLMFSCNYDNQLFDRITVLEKENKELKATITELKINKLSATGLVGLSENKDVIPNELNRYNFMFTVNKQMPVYNVYEVSKEDGKEVKKLIHEKLTDPSFYYDFIPKSNGNEDIKIQAEIDVDGSKLILFNTISINN